MVPLSEIEVCNAPSQLVDSLSFPEVAPHPRKSVTPHPLPIPEFTRATNPELDRLVSRHATVSGSVNLPILGMGMGMGSGVGQSACPL